MRYVLCAAVLGSALLSQASLRPAASPGRANAQDQGWRAHRHHSPPWAGPVASSQTIRIGDAAIQVDFGPGTFDLNQGDIVQWVQNAARAVADYYGKFPVPRARVLVLPIADRRGVLTGTTWGGVDGFPAFTRMRLGQRTTAQELHDDWTMTHELIHTALPSLAPEHHWLEEGLAVYIEPIARAKIGILTPQQVWAGMLRDMHQGEPAGTDGLDNTQSWASTYWGGALFCLMADVDIREKTHNHKGLRDAVRGIVADGGSIAVDWPIERVLDAGDRATRTTVLADLYKKMGTGSYTPIDLDKLWQELGVRSQDGKIVFNNRAPLAKIREGILAR